MEYCPFMRKLARILWIVLVVLIALLAAAWIALQTPRVQTYALDKLAGKFLEGKPTEIHFDRIRLRPFNTIVIRNLAIIDKEPQYPCEEVMEKLGIAEFIPQDTLFAAGYIVAKFELVNPTGGGGFHLSKVLVRDGLVNVVVEEKTEYYSCNLQRMFDIRRGDGEMKEKTKDVFEIDKAVLKNMRYSMQIIRKKRPYIKPGGIDWTDLDIRDVWAEGSNLRMSKGIMTATLEKCRFREKSGYVCDNISASTAVGMGQAVVEDIHLQDPWSDARFDHYTMSFAKPKAFRTYVDSVRMDLKILPCDLSLKTLSYFLPPLRGMSGNFRVEGQAEGYFPGINIRGLKIATPDDSFRIRLDGRVNGLPKTDRLGLNMSLSECSGSVGAVERMAGEILGKEVSFGDKVPDFDFDLGGSVKGALDDLKTKVDLKTNLGGASADLRITDLTKKEKELKISGDVSTRNLNVGKIIGKDIIGPVSMSTTLSASLRGAGGPAITVDPANITRLNLNRYDYSGIVARGSFSKSKFDGRIACHDPNLNFLFQGIFALSPKTRNSLYKFYANIGHADLKALNIAKKVNSTAALRVNADFVHSGGGDLRGNIKLADIVLTSNDEKHELGTVQISSFSKPEDYHIELSSSFAEASYTGTSPVTRFVTDLIGLTAKKEVPSLFADPAYKWNGDSYDLSFKCINTSDITAFLKPGLYVDNDTSMDLHIDGDANLTARVKSRRIAMRDKYLKFIDCRLDNASDCISGTLDCEDIKVGTVLLQNNSIQIFADDDNIGVGYSCRGSGDDSSEGLKTAGEFYVRGEFARAEDNVLDLNIGVLPSSFRINSDEWSIMPAQIGIHGGDIKVDEMNFSNGEQDLSVSGGFSRHHADTLSVILDKFSLGNVNNFLSNDLYRVGGKMTGEALVTSGEDKPVGLLCDFLIDSTSFSGTSLGTVLASSRWNDENKRMDISLANSVDGRSSIDAQGSFTPSTKNLDLVAKLDRFDVGVAKPLFKGVFSDMSGYMSGRIYAEGPLNELEIASDGGRFVDTRLTVDYTHVPYVANGPFFIDSYGLVFNDIEIKDDFKGTGVIRGGVSFNHFKDIKLNTVINVRDMLCMDIPEKGNDGFYGRIFANGDVTLTGPTRAVNIGVNAVTSSPGELHIPTSSAGKTATNLLKFKEREEVVYIDEYDLMMNNYATATRKKGSDLSVKVRVQATPVVETFLEVDRESGNRLSGFGNGLIDIEVRPSRSIFNLKGDYTISSGIYKFVALGIAQRDFTIKEGSSIKFNGAVADSDLNIDAIYKTKAAISTLIADDESVSARRNVECGLNISDKLSNPKLKFSIDIPDLNPSTKSKVENALSTEDKVQKQFLSLLISNGFLPDEQSGIVNNSSVLYSNVAELMAGQLSNILQKLDIPVDLGLNYQPNEKGTDIFDVAVSTQLFNNRVVVNGNIGNRQYSTTSSAEVVGDVDIEIKLDRPGALRLNLFSHSADQYTNYLDNSQRNGLGLTYQQEYNRFKDMIRRLFAGRKKREKLDLEEQERIKAEGVKVITIE